MFVIHAAADLPLVADVTEQVKMAWKRRGMQKSVRVISQTDVIAKPDTWKYDIFTAMAASHWSASYTHIAALA